MTEVADAPWILEAMIFGGPEEEDVCCPCCLSACSRIGLAEDGEAIGCDECLTEADKWVDAWEWADEHREW